MKAYFGSPRPAELLRRPLLNRNRATFCVLTQIGCFSDAWERVQYIRTAIVGPAKPQKLFRSFGLLESAYRPFVRFRVSCSPQCGLDFEGYSRSMMFARLLSIISDMRA